MLEDYFYLGKVTKPHGFKGNLIAYLETDEPERYSELELVYMEFDGIPTPFLLQETQAYGKSRILFKLANQSAEDAQKFVGKKLYLPLSELPELDDDQFYYHEIIGFKVLNHNAIELGEILTVNDNGPQVLIEISDNTAKHLIPLVDEWIVQVDKKEGYIKMNLPHGLLDLD